MVKVRFCPSNTGLLHVGTVRTCLYSYLFAKQNNGKIVFRMEDTDKERSTEEYAKNIISGLTSLGLVADEGIASGVDNKEYYQSNRTEIYKKYLKELIKLGGAYYCFCSKEKLDEERKVAEDNKSLYKYSYTCRPDESINVDEYINSCEAKIANGEKATIRLKVSKGNEDIIFNDLIRGEIKFNTKEFDDFIIAKSINEPLYNFSVVVDDYLMEITHIIRGEDHISNTPKQIMIYKVFGWGIPLFAHLPLILNTDKTKMSKRKNKVSVDDYLSNGYLKDALLNFLFLLGFNTADEQEIFSIDDMIKVFKIENVHKGGAIFDIKKLEWVNGQYIRNSKFEDFFVKFNEKLSAYNIKTSDFSDDFLKKIALIEKERINLFNEIEDDLYLLNFDYNYNMDLFLNSKFEVTADVARTSLNKAIELIESSDFDYSFDGFKASCEDIKNKFLELVKDIGLQNKQVLWVVRFAFSNKERGLGFAEIIWALGRDRSIEVLKTALGKIC